MKERAYIYLVLKKNLTYDGRKAQLSLFSKEEVVCSFTNSNLAQYHADNLNVEWFIDNINNLKINPASMVYCNLIDDMQTILADSLPEIKFRPHSYTFACADTSLLSKDLVLDFINHNMEPLFYVLPVELIA